MHAAGSASEAREKKEGGWAIKRKTLVLSGLFSPNEDFSKQNKPCFFQLKADHQNEFIKAANGHYETFFEATLDNEH